MRIVILPFKYLGPESEIREGKNECNDPELCPESGMMSEKLPQVDDDL